MIYALRLQHSKLENAGEYLCLVFILNMGMRPM